MEFLELDGMNHFVENLDGMSHIIFDLFQLLFVPNVIAEFLFLSACETHILDGLASTS